MTPKQQPRLRGEANPAAKLTAAAVRDIRARYGQPKVTMRQLAMEYGVSLGAIQAVIEQRSWIYTE